MIKNAFILNFFKLYNMLWKLCLPFLGKNKRLMHGFKKRITSFHHSRADIWIQAASAGEAYLALNIIQRLVPEKPIKILLTSTTSQGIDILKTLLDKKNIHREISLKIEWFPFDIPQTIQQAIEKINPHIMVLLETEIWPALLYYLKQNQTKIFIANARISKKSHFLYMKTKFLWKHLAPDLILSTSKQDAQRYRQIFKNTQIKTMPNIKFDSMEIQTHGSDTAGNIKKILPGNLPLTILASIRRKEENQAILIIKTIKKEIPDQVIAVFPRHMHRIDSWKKKLNSQNLKFNLKSTLAPYLPGAGIILWDSFGELKEAYKRASAVFVGGSLKPLGGQNFIEPAIQGAPTVTGPYYDDFAWVTDEIFKKKIVIKANNWKSAAQNIITILKAEKKLNKEKTNKDKTLAMEYIRKHQGGTLKVCHELLKALGQLP